MEIILVAVMCPPADAKCAAEAKQVVGTSS
jgi:hypothetical protein